MKPTYDRAAFLKDVQRRKQEEEARSSGIPFLRVGEGKHIIRFLPTGNKEENLPYRSVRVHTFQTKSQSGKPYTSYALCWDWMFGHDNCEEVTLQPLIKRNLLTKTDLKLYKNSGGCPACRAEALLRMEGEKDKSQNLRNRRVVYWNVVVRPENKIAVYSMSEKIFLDIAMQIEEYLELDESGKPGEDAIDILDPKRGYDFALRATGQMLKRRYSVSVVAKPRPLNLAEGEAPVDLMDVVANSFRSYAEMCALVKEYAGKLLQSYQFDYGIDMKPVKSVDEDEDEDYDDDVDTDDEDEAPIKSKKSTSKRPPFDTDEDEDEDDDDFEEPKPKKKSSNNLKPKKKASLYEDDDEDGLEDSEDDEDMEGTIFDKKKKVTPSNDLKKKKKVIIEDEEDDNDVDDDEIL